SLSAKAEKAKILENEPLYEIVPADLSHFPAMQRKLGKSRNEIVLIDLPGKMDDDGLIPIFSAADTVICPFAFDEFSVDCTLLFAIVIGKINTRAPLIFVPSRIQNTVKYERRTEVENLLRGFGTVAPDLP